MSLDHVRVARLMEKIRSSSEESDLDIRFPPFIKIEEPPRLPPNGNAFLSMSDNQLFDMQFKHTAYYTYLLSSLSTAEAELRILDLQIDTAAYELRKTKRGRGLNQNEAKEEIESSDTIVNFRIMRAEKSKEVHRIESLVKGTLKILDMVETQIHYRLRKGGGTPAQQITNTPTPYRSPTRRPRE